jgi:hypothetical protein
LLSPIDSVSVVKVALVDAPEEGLTIVVLAGHASTPTGVANVTLTAHCPGARFRVILAGQVRIGGVVSVTVIVRLHDAEFPDVSVAVQVTMDAPTGKMDADGIPEDRVTLGTSQLSCVDGPENVIFAPQCPSISFVMLPLHVSVGGSKSMTVTKKVQDAQLLAAS